ncbi:putative inorganic polyphosphate/ATP-NAD kinase [Wickerhamomyces ciferrii]|uniref:Inorganic polyphosphate/ATP-NAD kinase n=1 Tax=Wickerhamomyces ciferrii (strain ATCC 14091 / BCRC 22168 / CBS 111 / JCM 3599 / NBRC 0793 / NRRL Y-1031 F-60-10) TaxID=1206466 RepID=K0KL40_WICCF|nr:putative inorganic polyphosphate/ATP-NAD kinase [Wickerhamomyces ciferrii]CCH45955.1 putative inorganic polyphosphate/ATP-NAD kinase [Wickerhamomyces ciferrii]
MHGPIQAKQKSHSQVPTKKDLEMTNGEDTKTLLKRISNSSNDLKQNRSHQNLSEQAHNVRLLQKNLSKTTVKLDAKNVLIVTKARDNSLVYLTREMAEWLLINYKNLNVYVDYHLERSRRFNPQSLIRDIPRAKTALKYWDKRFINENSELIDLVITLGGDGTVLYTSSLFQRSVPPVMSFSLGSLGFLTTFQYEEFRETLKIVLEKGIRTNLRMRLSCRVHKSDGSLVCEQQALNEVTIDRGPSPFVSMLELFGDGNLLTVAQADGLIIATPTGSTAYSLSAGGSLVHPNVSAISVTPICPHTLSFRPILLPDSMVLKVRVPKRSRSTAWAAFDGRSRVELQKGDYVSISASPFSMPTVMSSPTEYFDSVSRTLNWNIREQQKSFVHLLSTKNKKNYEVNQLSKPKFKLNMDSDSENSESEQNESEEQFEAGHESPDDIDDNDLSTYYMPPPGQGIDTPPVIKSHAATPTLSPRFKGLDVSALTLDKFKK